MVWSPLSSRVPQVFQVPVLTQTLPPHRHTNSFVIGKDELIMVDAGQWDDACMEALRGFLDSEPGRKLRLLLLSHWHPDHSVGAEEVRRQTGCAVGIPVYQAEKGIGGLWDFTFRDSDRLTADGEELEVIHTPGHSSDHCCFLLREGGVLFTGDHVLGAGTSIIVPPDGDMALYLESLHRLLAYPVEIICPGHGPVVWRAKAKIQEYIAHRFEREHRILEAVRGGLRRPEDIVAAVYTDVPVSFHGMAYYTVLAHLAKLEKESRVRMLPDNQGYASE